MPESAVVYTRLEPERLTLFCSTLQQALPDDIWRERTPLGMERLARGIAYGERKTGDPSSHGESRCNIIVRALKQAVQQPPRPFTEILDQEIQAAGYRPDNPARLLPDCASRS